jgi:hypothetical protein
MSEYLRFNPPEWLETEVPRAQELVESGKIMGVAMLSQIMTDASWQLITTPGPHVWEREKGAGSWILWWAEYFNKRLADNSKRELVESRNVGTLEEIGLKVKSLGHDFSSGLLLAATAEGTDGHRFAVDWMKEYVSLPILLLEDEGYFQRHPQRRKPFLPISVRISMWATYGILTGLIPDNASGMEEGSFYDNLVRNRMEVDYSFASAGDPQARAKVKRGKKSGFFTTIPEFDSWHTSDRTQKLM